MSKIRDFKKDRIRERERGEKERERREKEREREERKRENNERRKLAMNER